MNGVERRAAALLAVVEVLVRLGGGVEASPFKVTKPREFELRTFDYHVLLTTTGAPMATTGADLA